MEEGFVVKRESIEFIKASTPILEPITKFGGQPVWVSAPQWPKSRTTGNPMRFIGQIAIDPARFSPISARIAYLFMTDEDEFVDGTWEPDGGENAVILQPGTANAGAGVNGEGPSLYKMVQKPAQKLLEPEPCEYSVKLEAGEDPDLADEVTKSKWTHKEADAYDSTLLGNKIGGTPGFVQRTEFPGPGNWRLLLQLDSSRVPFTVNFGDVGVGYVFLSDNGNTAKFLWQCS